jgi:hypothetical protein
MICKREERIVTPEAAKNFQVTGKSSSKTCLFERPGTVKKKVYACVEVSIRSLRPRLQHNLDRQAYLLRFIEEY